MIIKNIENYINPKVPSKGDFLSANNIVSVISIGLLTFTLSCSSNVNLIEDNPSTSDSLLQSTNNLTESELNKINSTESIGSLETNYPNPFMPTTTINYTIKNNSDQPDSVNVSFYDLKGKLIRTLIDDFQKSGEYKFEWNGKDNEDLSVESGVYFYKLVINGKEVGVKKMILLK